MEPIFLKSYGVRNIKVCMIDDDNSWIPYYLNICLPPFKHPKIKLPIIKPLAKWWLNYSHLSNS